LNEFCRKYFVKGGIEPTKQDVFLFQSRYDSLKANIFEAMMLYESVSFKVYGENVPLSILLNEMAIKGVEDLIEQGALKFVHWTPMIMHVVGQIDGVNPIAAGRLSSDVHTDPEASIKRTFDFMKNKPNKKQRNMLTRKVRDLYIEPEKGLEHDASNFVMSAYNSGKLKCLGLDNSILDIYKLNTQQKKLLNNSASELLEHKFLVSHNLMPHKTKTLNSLFSDSISKISRTEAAIEISKFENFPDLHNLSLELGNPLQDLPKYRNQKNTRKFRSWLNEVSDSQDLAEITAAYINSIDNAKGFFETKKGRLTKNVTMTGIGSFLGPAGTALGGFAGPALVPAADFVLDLVDEYFVTELLKGWKPRMFIDDMRKLQEQI
jgi:hypothetical protein